ncbi:MAG: hypothetical protein ACPL88_07470, partial [Bryobacteraceae bacterium]
MSEANGAILISRRALLGGAFSAAADASIADDPSSVHVEAGVDRIVVLPGKTYLRGWVGTGRAPSTTRPRNAARIRPEEAPKPVDLLRVHWRKLSG